MGSILGQVLDRSI